MLAALIAAVLLMGTASAFATNFNLGTFWKKRASGPVLIPGTWTAVSGQDMDLAASMLLTLFPYGYSSEIRWTGTDFAMAGYSLLSSGLSMGYFNPVSSTWGLTSSTSLAPAFAFSQNVWAGSKMVSLALDSGSTQTLTVYDSATDLWTPSASTPPVFPSTPMVWTGSVIAAWGGFYVGSGVTMNTGSRYNPSTDTWSAMSGTSAPAARYGHSGVWTGTQAVYWGGMGASSTLLNSGGRYNPTSNTWTATSTTGSVPSARWLHSAIMAGSKMYVWGGATSSDGSTLTNTGAAYDPSANSWTALSTSGAPSARIAPGLGWTGSHLIVYGGSDVDGVFLNSGGVYNPSNNTWTAMAPAPFLGIDSGSLWTPACQMAWSGSKMLVSCGASFLSALYDPATNTWDEFPFQRTMATVVAAGTKVLIWSGYSIHFYFNSLSTTGQILDLATQSRSPMADSSGIVEGRIGNSAVWTGTKMLIWGGTDPNKVSVTSSGAYTLATDSWSAMSTTDEPTQRSLHSTVWTGSEMIVWGGEDEGGTDLNTGGRYNPATDSWSPTATAGAPAARESHSAVWVNSKMVVWGGVDSSSNVLSGGSAYNPSTNSWAALSATSPPSARSKHTAVSTGTKMIVWGGYDSSGNGLNTGKIYDPVANTWTAMSTSGAPTARGQHVAFWTGSKMIVWGGADAEGGNLLDTGGIYDPVANTWSAVSGIGAPSARGDFGAAWTGSQLLILGGMDSTTVFGSGGLYTP